MYQGTKLSKSEREKNGLPLTFQSASLLNKIAVKWNDPIDLFEGKYPIGYISHVSNWPVGLTCHLAALFLHGPYRHPLPLFRQYILIRLSIEEVFYDPKSLFVLCYDDYSFMPLNI